MGTFVRYNDEDLTSLIEENKNKGNFTPLLKAIGEYMLGDIDERFRTETDPDGNPWLPNSPYTIAKKRREGKILKILQRTGFMRSSAFYQVDGGDTLRVGLTDPKSAKHQFGVDVPKREIVKISKTQQQEIQGIVEDYFLLP